MALNLRLSPQEDDQLEAYCKSVRRTKTDVLREFVRSLPNGATERNEDYIPDGWERLDEGEAYDRWYSKHLTVDCCVYYQGDGFEIWFENERQAYVRNCQAWEAIAHAQRLIEIDKTEAEFRRR